MSSASSAIGHGSTSSHKKVAIEQIINLVKDNNSLGIASIDGVPSTILQEIRRVFRGKVYFKGGKNTLKLLALEKAKRSKKNLKKLQEHIQGSCILVFSNLDPWLMQASITSKKMPAYAKAGQISPKEVFVPSGVTDLAPGPVIGEFSALGISTRVEKGKIAISKNTKVLSEGEAVTEIHASVLARLGIQPFEIGLKMDAVFSDGEIYLGDDLFIDEKETLRSLAEGTQAAYNLAFFCTYPTEATISSLIQLANQKAQGLSLTTNYPTKSTASLLIQRSISQARALAKKIN